MSTDPEKVQVQDRIAKARESVTARLEGAKASQAQIRFSLGMMAVISMMMLIASYNAYLSYDYRWILDLPELESSSQEERNRLVQVAAQTSPAEKLSAEKRAAVTETVSKELRQQAYKDWASSRIVLISLLGIRVSVDDAAVLGTSILLILSAWLLLWARRENYTIGKLLRHTHKLRLYNNRVPLGMPAENRPQLYSSEERWLIFHAINSNSIFITVYSSFRSINSLEGEIRPASKGFKGWMNKVGFGILRNFFSLFPVIAAAIVLVIDRLSYFISDPFDPNFHPPGTDSYFWISFGVSLMFLSLLTVCCVKSMRYSRDTEEVLRQFENKLKAERLEQNQASLDEG